MEKTVLIFICLACMHGKHAAQQEPISDQLHKNLLRHYEPDVMPIFEPDGVVDVRSKLALIQIRSVDVHDSKFVALLYVNLKWKDLRLQWNETLNKGVGQLAIREEDVWVPDIRIWNSVAVERVFDNHIIVGPSGDCAYLAATQVTVTCKYDLTWFPFDEQTCEFFQGSWIYGPNVNISPILDKIDLPFYTEHEGWDLISAQAERREEAAYSYIRYSVEIKRKGSKYAFEYIVPAAVLSFLVPVLFVLPSDSSSRFSLGAGMLVSIMLLITLLGNIIPRELSTRPMLGTYYDLMFILVSLALALSAFISSISSKSTGLSAPPDGLKTVLLNVLGRILCVSHDRKYGTSGTNEMDSEGIVKSDGQFGTVAYEWRLIARVLDRIFLLVFLIIVVIGSIATLPK